MSNSRRSGSRPPLPHCARCHKKVRQSMMRKELPGAGVICERCISEGATFQRLGCGHMGVIGMKVQAAATPGMSVCARCEGSLDLTARVFGTLNEGIRL